MVKKSMKKVAMLFTVLSLGSVVVPGLVSSGVYAESVHNENVENKSYELKFTELSKKRFDLMLKVSKHIYFSSIGLMNLEITEQLKEKYNLSDSDVEEINAVLDSYNEGVWENKSRMVFEDYHLILDKADMAVLLQVASMYGPAGIASALAAMGSVIPGAGTIIAAVIGFFGASAIIGNASYAILTNKRLKLGLTGVSVVD